MNKINNRITGPTDFPPVVQEAINRPIISHRSQAFKDALESAQVGIQKILHTKNTPMFFTASGTGGLEAIVLNTLTKNSKVLSLSAGYYGDLWANIVATYLENCVVKEKSIPGFPVNPERVREILEKNTFDAILLTQTESSTGVLNPLPELIKVIKEYSDALILVDAISSVGTTDCFMDDWQIDVLVTVPQKALMAPPGLAIICASNRVLKLAEEKKIIGSFYFDFSKALFAHSKNQTPFTPNILAVIGIEASLKLIEKEGLEKVIQRHKNISQLCQKKILETGLNLFAQEGARAPGITAVHLPKALSALSMQEELEKNHGLLVTTGLDSWADQVIRIGHMGWVFENDIENAVQAIACYMEKKC